MNISKDRYSDMVKPASKNSRWAVNLLKAFVIGGGYALSGRRLPRFTLTSARTKKNAATWCSVTLIAASVLLTALGLYEKR